MKALRQLVVVGPRGGTTYLLLLVMILKGYTGLFVPWIALCQYGRSKCGFTSQRLAPL